MGMDYAVLTDKNPEVRIRIPERLSNFFETLFDLDGDEMREGVQFKNVSKIDFAIISECTNGENESEGWINIELFRNLLQRMIDFIKKNPDYYKQIKYGKSSPQDYRAELMEAIRTKDKQKMWDITQRMQANPDLQFPTDRGYLTKGFIREDLQECLADVESAIASGVRRVKIYYM